MPQIIKSAWSVQRDATDSRLIKEVGAGPNLRLNSNGSIFSQELLF